MKEHDYTKRYCGHDYVFTPVDNGLKGKITGWGKGLSAGDFLILQNGNDSTRYKINTIFYFWDPKDMWSAEVMFAPRKAHDD